MGVSQRLARLAAVFSIACCALAPQFTQAAEDKLLFWQVDTPGATVFLLGSMHLARPDIYPLRREILQAYEGADNLVVELDVRGEKGLKIQQRILERGQYPAGRTLQDDLSPETWAELSARLMGNGIPPQMMSVMKPGVVATMLMATEMTRVGLHPERGVDRYFLNLAGDSKPVLELETVDEQLDVILDLSEPEATIRQALDQLSELDRIIADMVTAWKLGDADDLAKQVIDDQLEQYPELADTHRRLIDERNRAMTVKITGMQSRGGSYFVVVGAAHLVGDRGIVALLEQRGQQPRQL